MASIDALQLFIEVVDRQSFTAAGRSLGLDPSVVSRRIRKLEDDLGVPLFHRTTRALTVTDEAQDFYERVAPALAAVAEARLELSSPDGRLRGPLRVAAPGAFGRIRVGPIVHRFAMDHPDVAVELLLSDRRLDLVRERVDVAVRIGTPSDPGQVIRTLGSSEQWAVAAPRYLEAHPPDGVDHRVVLRIESGRLIDIRPHFPSWVKGDIRVSLVTNDLAAAADAAVAGLGIAGLPRWLAQPHVEADRLAQMPMGPEALTIPIYAVMVAGRRSTRRARALTDALADGLRD